MQTEQYAFYFGVPNDAKPDDIHVAMNGTGTMHMPCHAISYIIDLWVGISEDFMQA